MDRINEDMLGLILRRVLDPNDRNSCSEVCKNWARVEGQIRTKVRILEPGLARNLMKRFPNLTTLEINKKISDKNLKAIVKACPELLALNLCLDREQMHNSNVVDFGNGGLVAVARACRKLIQVSLRMRRRIDDVGVVALVKNVENLSVLDLSWCSGIADKSLDVMGEMRSLEELYLKGCSLITDYGLLSLATGSCATTLRVLDLYDCDRITDLGVGFLQSLSCLEELNLEDCGPKITDEGGVAISSIGSLRRLNLSWLINITDVTLSALAQNCPKLTQIKLRGCESIAGYGVREIATNGALEMVGLSRLLINVKLVEDVLLLCQSLRHFVLDKSLRKWLTPEVKERLSMVDRVDWV